MKKNKDNAQQPGAAKEFFKVVALEGKESADMLLYGYIGQEAWMEEDRQYDLTDIAFTKEFRRLEKSYNRINIRINSSGGSVKDGDAIITAIQSSDAEVHVYNDGTAASMAADIWLAVGDKERRHMSANAKLMIHSTISWAWGNAAQMRETADMLDKFDQAAVGSLAKALGKSEEDVLAEYYDGRDHWLTAKEALALGLIAKIEADADAEGGSADSSENKRLGQLDLFEQRLAALEAAREAAPAPGPEPPAAAPEPEADPEPEPEDDGSWKTDIYKKRLMLLSA
jgi:ATP-dependent Clp endopeptidase proteolytic subunit ClpP